MPHSLILAEQATPAQLSFFESDEFLGIADRNQPAPHYTGDRLFRDRPHIYRRVVELLAEPGISVRYICRELHVTDGTVAAVSAREGIPMAAHKKVILRNITHGLRMASERLIEEIPRGSLRDTTIAVGVLSEKMQLLSGEATARIEVTPGGNIFERFARFHEETIKAVEGRTLPALEMGFETGNAAAKGIEAGEVAGEGVSEGVLDAESSVSTPLQVESDSDASDLPVERPGSAGVSEPIRTRHG